MSGNDLIVAAPWILFVVAVAVVCFLLLSDRPRRAREGALHITACGPGPAGKRPPGLPEMIFI